MRPRKGPRSALAKELGHLMLDNDVDSVKELAARLGWFLGRLNFIMDGSPTSSLTDAELTQLTSFFNLSPVGVALLQAALPQMPVKVTFKDVSVHGAKLLGRLETDLACLDEAHVAGIIDILDRATETKAMRGGKNPEGEATDSG